MKPDRYSFTLDEAMLREAVRAQVEADLEEGYEVAEVRLSATAGYDAMDRPTGGHAVSATIVVRRKQ